MTTRLKHPGQVKLSQRRFPWNFLPASAVAQSNNDSMKQPAVTNYTVESHLVVCGSRNEKLLKAYT